jgi:hypothetical protein
MNRKLLGEAFLATLAFGNPILQIMLKPEEYHYETHFEVEVVNNNLRTGINTYNIGKISPTNNKTYSQLVTIADRVI